MQPDFAARLAATNGNPSAFSSLVFGTPLHAGQTRYLKHANADVNFLLPGNSFGKTELALRKMIYEGWFKLGKYPPRNFEEWLSKAWRGAITSYNYPIAKESFLRLLKYRRTREELAMIVSRVIETDPPFIELSNGSRIDWGSLDVEGKLVEAARFNSVIVDEAGHIPDLATTFDNILFPRTMGVGGRVHLFGTPKPHSDPYLLEIYEKGKDGNDPFYYSQSGSCLENEFWPAEEKERVLSNPRYVTGWEPCERLDCDYPLCSRSTHPILTPVGRQVILGHFVLAGGFFFSRPHVAKIFTKPASDYVWHGENYFYKPPKEGRIYLAAFDLAGNKLKKRKKGKGSDPTVGFVVDYTERPWEIVYYRYIEGGDMDWNEKYQVMSDVFHDYPMQYLLIDATGTVDSVGEALIERGVEVEGVQFGGAGGKKLDMLRNLQLCMELQYGSDTGVIRGPLIPRLKYELDHYVLPDDDIEQDTVMALAMVLHHISAWELPPAHSGDVW